jgi:hypothetical protein
MSIQATARILLTIEVTAGSWGDECSMKQVYDQSARDAREKLERLGFRVIGEPRVTAVLAEKTNG